MLAPTTQPHVPPFTPTVSVSTDVCLGGRDSDAARAAVAPHGPEQIKGMTDMISDMDPDTLMSISGASGMDPAQMKQAAEVRTPPRPAHTHADAAALRRP